MKKGTRLQVYDRGDHVMPGPRGLVAAVLIRSLEDARNGGERHAATAQAWIQSDRYGPLSFRWTYETLNLDPRRIRLTVVKTGFFPDRVSD